MVPVQRGLLATLSTERSRTGPRIRVPLLDLGARRGFNLAQVTGGARTMTFRIALVQPIAHRPLRPEFHGAFDQRLLRTAADA